MVLEAKRIVQLEKLALAAWPAAETLWREGWALRAAHGYTKRANSANAITPAPDFATVRQAVESFYEARGLPVVFRLSPLAPDEADASLAAAGYVMADPSRVMIAALSAATATSDEAHVANDISLEWLDGFAAANAVAESSRPLHDDIIRRIAGGVGFAVLRQDGREVGYGLAVCADNWIGLFDLVIAPDARGQGLGRRLVNGLLGWGRTRGATRAYLQVRDQNIVARQLYAGCGFTDAYPYHYRIRALRD